MNKLTQLVRLASHPRELRLALSGLGMRLGGDEALGGLTKIETDSLVSWVNELKPKTFIEIGTLFGFTARTLAQKTDAKVIAVDKFCWNPFGLTPAQHEDFTRHILEGTDVELVNADAFDFLSAVSTRCNPAETMIFLDGSHAYADVKRELEICRAAGIRFLSGHDFANSIFGVTKAVREVVGEPDAVGGMCWLKR